MNTISRLEGVDASSISVRETMLQLNQHMLTMGENVDLIKTKSILLIARRLLDQAILNGYQNTFIFLAFIFSAAIIPALFIKLPGVGGPDPDVAKPPTGD